MADIERLAPKILRWEGGFVNHHADRGGATNMGITIATWKRVGYDKDGDGDIDVADLKLVTKADALRVVRIYWDRWKADRICNQSVADILVDWVWGSGKWGIVIPQRILHVKQDGIVGEKTLAALNSADQKKLHAEIYWARINFFDDLVRKDPRQQVFVRGWKNRLATFVYSD